MTVAFYLYGYSEGTRELTLPDVGGTVVQRVNDFYTITVRHVSRAQHPLDPQDHYFEGYDDTYELSLSSEPAWDLDRMENSLTLNIYDHDEGTPRPANPSYSTTDTSVYRVAVFRFTLRRNDIMRVYTDTRGWFWETLDNPDPALKLYLVTHYFTLTYDANGGQGAPPRQQFYWRQFVNLSAVLPSRARHRFLGWSEDRSARTPTYSQPGYWFVASAPARNVTLYAVWETLWTYLPMRVWKTRGGTLVRSDSNGLIIRHGDAPGDHRRA